jgi:hypothetical protein
MPKYLLKTTGRAALFCGLVFMLALGACENPSGGNSAAQETAEEFRDSHRVILEKSVDRATLNDEAAIDAALEAYGALDDEAKAGLAAEKEKLDSLKARMNTRRASTAAIHSYLEAQPDNTVDTPYYVAYTGTAAPGAIYDMLAGAGKYVTLDLSKSDVGGFEYDAEEGRKWVVRLILPDSLEEIEGITSLRIAPVFDGFTHLKTVQAGGLLTVGNYAFANCVSLEEINLPRVTKINMGAFYGCTGLKTVNLPESVTLDMFAFYGCTSLTAISLPKAAAIGNSMFYGCTALTTVNLPEAVTIGSDVFRSCTSLTTISLPKAVGIAGGVFQDCAALTTVNLPEAATIGSDVFRSCTSLTAISLPKAVSIGVSGVFQDCTALTTVNLPEAVTIGSYVFQNCTGLTAISLPKVSGVIDDNAFNGCTGLTTVILGSTPPTLIRQGIFQGAAVETKTITFKVPADKLDIYKNTAVTTGKTWEDVTGKLNSAAANFWDTNPDTRDNLTVALEAL